ncbi:hypothetical protein AQUCO_01300317v1 [Aquilegia coerulea]|uniref:SLH domain-containing protein n=1 Tax=Aquilegia coerulea TaxID=218851 RepID=A0A2G5E0W2_AQUCA|nr:hypothetical protein AQUCO_01300317v1 [Aquilegia coerulea]
MSSALTINSSPNSIQLRLGFKCRKSSFVYIRTTNRVLRTVNRQIRLYVAASSSSSSSSSSSANEAKEGEPSNVVSGNSWTKKNSSNDSFSGWVDDNDSSESQLLQQQKSGRGGIVAAGVAGVILAAGLTFTCVYLSKRTASAPKPDMESLTAQQETLLSDDHNDNIEQVGNEEIIPRPDEGIPQDDTNADSMTALQVPPGKVVVYGVVDQVQGQALAALQVLKVIEADVQPGDLCTRREYARWLVSASSALSRNSMSKVYPAMYIENVTELAFDDITTEDPDFASIQGLAEAGLISSKLSRNDLDQTTDEGQDPFLFFPESPVSRQDLVSWKMALEKRQLPEVDKKIVYRCCGFIDIDKINPDAWPALVADQSAGEQGIMALAFGYTRLFQPHKPVTKGQAAIALSTGEAAEIVSEELARIEAETMAEAAVAAHSALVAQVEKDINYNYEKELTMEREKIDAVEKMAQEARMELERLRAEREEEQNSLMRGQAAVESEMQVLSSLRREVEEQLQSLMSDKTEISFERERINKLRKEAESENQTITQLQYELEVERKALSLARAWAEDEAKRAREQARALEEARDRWERHGIKVVVDDDLREDANAGVTWLSAGKESTVDAAVSRGESLVSKLKKLAGEISGNSRLVIERIILKITTLIASLKEWASNSARKAGELQGVAVSKASASVQELQHSASSWSLAVKEGAKRVADDCRDGVERISQKFKA